jgi:hypothetical protein
MRNCFLNMHDASQESVWAAAGRVFWCATTTTTAALPSAHALHTQPDLAESAGAPLGDADGSAAVVIASPFIAPAARLAPISLHTCMHARPNSVYHLMQTLPCFGAFFDELI